VGRDGWRLLVSEGRAGVGVDNWGGEEHLLLVRDTEERSGTLLERTPSAIEDGACSVVGGRLPDRAAKAEVIDLTGQSHDAAVGGGAFVAVVPGHFRELPPTVMFRGPRGGLIANPRDPDARFERLEEVEDPCPACGRVGWEIVRVVANEYGSGDIEWESGRCRHCGHEESLGGRSLRPPRREPDHAAESEPWPEDPVAGAPFAVYEAVGGPPGRRCAVVAGFNGAIDSVGITRPDGDVCVGSSRAEARRFDAETSAREHLAGAVRERAGGARPYDIDERADHLRELLSRRRLRGIAATGRARQVEVAVDGQPYPFVVVEVTGACGFATVEPVAGETEIAGWCRGVDVSGLDLRRVRGSFGNRRSGKSKSSRK
jgi:hypothetical protein